MLLLSINIDFTLCGVCVIVLRYWLGAIDVWYIELSTWSWKWYIDLGYWRIVWVVLDHVRCPLLTTFNESSWSHLFWIWRDCPIRYIDLIRLAFTHTELFVWVYLWSTEYLTRACAFILSLSHFHKIMIVTVRISFDTYMLLIYRCHLLAWYSIYSLIPLFVLRAFAKGVISVWVQIAEGLCTEELSVYRLVIRFAWVQRCNDIGNDSLTPFSSFLIDDFTVVLSDFIVEQDRYRQQATYYQ